MLATLILCGSVTQAADRQFLNVSYDATREFYDEFNKSYGAYWKSRTGQTVEFKQSHGGSGKQARSVVDGLKGDVVTLALANDINEIVKSGQIKAGWQKEFPYNSAPYTSTIVFMVRKGNPKKIQDWKDLTRPGVQIITPNPKTGGLPRWIYLSAWGYALKQPGGNDAKARDFVKSMYKNVKVMDSAARASMTTFAERGMGDVLLTWENEALVTLKTLGRDKYDIVYPSISILTEPSVAIVDKTVEKNGNKWLATGYINYLYSPLGQEMAAKYYYRPRNQKVMAKYAAQFPKLKTFTIDEVFGGWSKAQQTHFVNGATFDQIYNDRR
ncbi:sulfate ABC transporter substrate-binding protein [Acinetobacter radioresistens]|uniref:sulfate ABC transporter substrate-binding protein n=1 Tax=Acinetobacter TaxID=469 RepID=UPI000277C4A6|nr:MULTISPECIES: sulfate ABC transporter substrate-binding protein [Acinetobacter]EJO34376.1 sulfate-binding protein [Acinetobacter radioresistens WC-A-157]EXB35630.1 sulfate ABC transporter, sulfate-binding family protein [Acinetobacter sp. 1461402]EXB73508.1 sulfate ABC transporter, sulfate-binding family protein [Acinetobacter sp. 230853]EXC33951.1 sulfate ABC transporter, sulfate-binding family protein [Acinetobacter sp. 869535]EXE14865.1 sulfate ABC transporter, sulfate-binding family pro